MAETELIQMQSIMKQSLYMAVRLIVKFSFNIMQGPHKIFFIIIIFEMRIHANIH